jgi:hypothetical protein
MVFNAIFNNISVISWWSVLLVEETGGPGENHWSVASHWQTLSHNVVHLALVEIWTHNISGYRHWMVKFINWGNQSNRKEKISNMLQIINKLYHKMLHWIHLAMAVRSTATSDIYINLKILKNSWIYAIYVMLFKNATP